MLCRNSRTIIGRSGLFNAQNLIKVGLHNTVKSTGISNLNAGTSHDRNPIYKCQSTAVLLHGELTPKPISPFLGVQQSLELYSHQIMDAVEKANAERQRKWYGMHTSHPTLILIVS